jgi:hypothetical protein
MENKEDILQSQQQQHPPTKKPKLKKKKGGAKLVLMKSKSHKVVPSFLDHLPPGPATYCKIDSLVKPTFNRVYSEPPTTFEDFQIRGFGTETQKSNKPRWNATATTGKPKPMVSRVDSSLFVFILILSFFLLSLFSFFYFLQWNNRGNSERNLFHSSSSPALFHQEHQEYQQALVPSFAEPPQHLVHNINNKTGKNKSFINPYKAVQTMVSPEPSFYELN